MFKFCNTGKYMFHNTESISKSHFLQSTHILLHMPITAFSLMRAFIILIFNIQSTGKKSRSMVPSSRQNWCLLHITGHILPQKTASGSCSHKILTFNSIISDEWQMLSGKSRRQQEQRHNSCCLSYRGTASFHEWKSFSAPAEITACMGSSFSKVEQPYVTQYAFTGSKCCSTYVPSW